MAFVPLIIGTNGHVAAIDPETGDELWRTRLQPSLLASTRWEDVSVLVYGNTVYAGSNGHLFALDIADGTLLWSNGLKGLGHNDISLALPGVSVQFTQRTVRRSNSIGNDPS